MGIRHSLMLNPNERRQIDAAVQLLQRCPAALRRDLLMAAANVGRQQHTLDATLCRLDALTLAGGAQGGMEL